MIKDRSKKKNQWLISPETLETFQCIGSRCEDNCCIGWAVDIDHQTYEKYRKLKHPALSERIQKSLFEKPDCYDPEIDFAGVQLTGKKRCSLLDSDNLCSIQRHKGVGYLSNVCYSFPRYYHRVDDTYFQTATLSCPEAARMMLLDREPVKMSMKPLPEHLRFFVTYQVDTAEESNPRLKGIRKDMDQAVSLLQNRQKSLPLRVLDVAVWLETLSPSKKKMGTPPNTKTDSKNQSISIETDWDGVTDWFQQFSKELGHFNKLDSNRYSKMIGEITSAFGYQSKQKWVEGPETLKKAFSKDYLKWQAEHEYLLENYLVHYVYKKLFPASDPSVLRETGMMLVFSYVLLNLQLSGLFLARKGLTPEQAVDFIQAYSKTVEHHHSFWEGMLAAWQKQKQPIHLEASRLLVLY